MPSFRVDIEFSYGWCKLDLHHSDKSITIKNHWLTDSFPDLVDALRLILTGTKAVSVPWMRELSGGHFIDLVADPRDGINLAVHEMQFGEDAETPEQIFSAVRGAHRFQARITIGEFAQAFAAALRRVRTNQADTTGLIEHWQHPFPQFESDAVERLAKKYGYQPEHALGGYV